MKFQALYEQTISAHQLDTDMVSILEFSAFIQFANEAMLCESTDFVTESFLLEAEGKIGKLLGAAGLHLHKGQGIVQLIAKAGKQFGKIILALWNARKGGEAEKAALKQTIQDSKVSKEQMLDFLFKLDAATLHLITGPIHTLDAVMGWHIWPEIKKKAEGMSSRVGNALNTLRSVVRDLPKKAAKLIGSALKGVEHSFKTHTNMPKPA